MTHRLLRGALVAFAFASLLAGCATNPVTGRREFTLVTPEQEAAIGKEGYPAAIAEYGLYDDRVLAAFVDSVGQRVGRVSDLPNQKWTFTVLDDPAVNAFAMPGGYIFITRGILAYLESEAQLAGVLGHEIGHVTARHSAKQITQQQLAGLGLGLASVFSETFRNYGGAAQQALGLLMLKYSRDDETQADALGIRYSTAAGYDPREVPRTYATLARISERAGQRLPAFLSTHPDPGDREQRTTTLAAQAAQGKSGLIVHGREMLQREDGLVFGEDPRQGYFEAGRYYHPQLAFEMSFPAGWQTQNGRAAVTAVAPQNAGVMQLSMAPNAGNLGPEDYVAALARDGRIASSSGGSESIGGWPAWVGRVTVPGANGAAAKTLVAAFVRNARDLFQFLGQTAAVGDAYESAIFASIRTLRRLQDPARANPTPARIRLVRAPVSGTFTDVFARLGSAGLTLEEAAILNAVEPTQNVNAGEMIKVVDPDHRR